MKTETSVVRISHDLDERLDVLAERTGRSKSYYASKAITEYLEDREDYLLAVAAYEESKGKRRYSFEEVTKEFGLERGVHTASQKRVGETRKRRSKAS
jgi:RHH-type rel operon transcriptional repressor/antitoxin RelB